jgi:hypothetical protein
VVVCVSIAIMEDDNPSIWERISATVSSLRSISDNFSWQSSVQASSFRFCLASLILSSVNSTDSLVLRTLEAMLERDLSMMPRSTI